MKRRIIHRDSFFVSATIINKMLLIIKPSLQGIFYLGMPSIWLAIGLFTARHIETIYKQIDRSTLDSIQGPYQEARFYKLGFSSN